MRRPAPQARTVATALVVSTVRFGGALQILNPKTMPVILCLSVSRPARSARGACCAAVALRCCQFDRCCQFATARVRACTSRAKRARRARTACTFGARGTRAVWHQARGTLRGALRAHTHSHTRVVFTHTLMKRARMHTCVGAHAHELKSVRSYTKQTKPSDALCLVRVYHQTKLN